MKTKQKKTKIVSVRFSDTELKIIKQVAKTFKMSLSHAIHDLTIDGLPNEIKNLMINNE